MSGWIRFEKPEGGKLILSADACVQVVWEPASDGGDALLIGPHEAATFDPHGEFERIAAWLNSGARGVYVVGEGPMGKAAPSSAIYSRGLAQGLETGRDIFLRTHASLSAADPHGAADEKAHLRGIAERIGNEIEIVKRAIAAEEAAQ